MLLGIYYYIQCDQFNGDTVNCHIHLFSIINHHNPPPSRSTYTPAPSLLLLCVYIQTSHVGLLHSEPWSKVPDICHLQDDETQMQVPKRYPIYLFHLFIHALYSACTYCVWETVSSFRNRNGTHPLSSGSTQ